MHSLAGTSRGSAATHTTTTAARVVGQAGGSDAARVGALVEGAVDGGVEVLDHLVLLWDNDNSSSSIMLVGSSNNSNNMEFTTLHCITL